ncbi:MAG: FliM/FliN family flagellar motor switch protein [Rhodobacteraceae bacterium]|nr:FliM/FliN family flagellar motor switch protein [Paracoccaceae bacterium]
MADSAAMSVLQRMAAPKGVVTGLSEMTPARALRHALARAGDEVLGTAVGLREMAEGTMVPDDIAEGLPEPALFLLLEGADGARGVAIACAQVVGAVIEAQTIGQVLQTAAAERCPTRTDAALVGSFLDPALGLFGALLTGCAAPPPVDGFTCGAALTDARAVQMVLADAAHLRFRMEIDFALGAKTGKLQLVLPAERTASPAARKSAENWQGTLEKAVLGTSARLEAVLCRLRLPLAEITRFQVGDTLPLDGAGLDDVSLEGPVGATLIKARLGRSGPVRAVRLMLGGPPPAAPVMQQGAIASAAAPVPGPMDLESGLDAAPMGLEPGMLDVAPLEVAPLAAMDLGLPDPGGLSPAPLEAAPLDFDAAASELPAMPAPLELP